MGLPRIHGRPARTGATQVLAAERERIAHGKELEVARLRAQQERLADRAAQQDELRARRHQEAAEKEWRAKERAAAGGWPGVLG